MTTKSMELPRTFYIAQDGKGQPNRFLSFVQGKRGPQLALRGSSLGKIREKQEDSSEEQQENLPKRGWGRGSK